MEEVKEVEGGKKVGGQDLYLQSSNNTGPIKHRPSECHWGVSGSLEQQATCCRFGRGRSSIWGGVECVVWSAPVSRLKRRGVPAWAPRTSLPPTQDPTLAPT